MPFELTQPIATDEYPLPSFEGGYLIAAPRSGYIRFIDTVRLRTLAKLDGVAVKVHRRVGQFVPAGVPLLHFSRPKSVDTAAFLEAIDLGPVRTMEQDVELGVLQLVDIALKAISPAVNDPSTAINCVDQLSRLLVRMATRDPLPRVLFDPPGVARVVLSPLAFEHLLEVAFAQIVHYGRTDLSVSLRVLRAVGDVATVTKNPHYLGVLGAWAEAVAADCVAHLPSTAHAQVRSRLASVLGRAAVAR